MCLRGQRSAATDGLQCDATALALRSTQALGENGATQQQLSLSSEVQGLRSEAQARELPLDLPGDR